MKNAKFVLALLGGLALSLGSIAAESDTIDSSPADPRLSDIQPSSGASPRDSEVQRRDEAGASESSSSMFNQLDSNRDGHIDSKEAERSATTTSRFKALDQNSDGGISREEWRAGGNE